MTVDELIEAAKNERTQKRYQQSLALAKSAVEKAPESANAWWQLALSQYVLDNLAGASTALQKTVELAPRYAYGWTLYGRTLWRLGEDSKAQETLEHALTLDSDDDEALEILADLYVTAGDEEKQFQVLSRLALLRDVPPRFLNRLGILHYNRKNFFDAIEYYKRDAVQSDDPAPLFNLGLV